MQGIPARILSWLIGEAFCTSKPLSLIRWLWVSLLFKFDRSWHEWSTVHIQSLYACIWRVIYDCLFWSSCCADQSHYILLDIECNMNCIVGNDQTWISYFMRAWVSLQNWIHSAFLYSLSSRGVKFLFTSMMAPTSSFAMLPQLNPWRFCIHIILQYKMRCIFKIWMALIRGSSKLYR